MPTNSSEKDNWRKCPDCQRRITQQGLKGVEELQSWFIHEMERFFNAKGRRMIGWDEIIEGIRSGFGAFRAVERRACG